MLSTPVLTETVQHGLSGILCLCLHQMWIVFVFWVLFVCLFLPVEVEYVVENLWVTVKEELVALDNVVIA